MQVQHLSSRLPGLTNPMTSPRSIGGLGISSGSNVAFVNYDYQCSGEDFNNFNTAIPQQQLTSSSGSIRERKRLLRGEEDESPYEPPHQKLCGSVIHRIPCKARGVSKNHSAENAFFDVPGEAPHGLLLQCSNEECTSSLRRFRYCRVCAIPVSKRNFVNRHGHGFVHSAKEVKTRVDQVNVTFMDGPKMTCSPCRGLETYASSNGITSAPDGILQHKRAESNLFFEGLKRDEDYCESQQKLVSGNCRRCPCRARCMPKEHNATTAYFQIPPDASHGLSLSCSMKKCSSQSGGPRFRYCKVCDCPVAKRNFSKRHGHGMLHAMKRQEEHAPALVRQEIEAAPDQVHTLEDNSTVDLVSVSDDHYQADFTAVDSFFSELGHTKSSCLSQDREFHAVSLKARPTEMVSKTLKLCTEVTPGRWSSSRITELPNVIGGTRSEYFTVAPLSGLDMKMTVAMMESATLGIDFSTIFDTIVEC